MADKKIFLTRTVVYQSKHYQPDREYVFPGQIADEIIEKNAGEPVLEVKSDVKNGKQLKAAKIIKKKESWD